MQGRLLDSGAENSYIVLEYSNYESVLKPQSLDPASPIPLFHQIAEAIRERIREGDLPPGATLEPLREAAGHWGVNLHTVRRAYAALAREGLVESRRGRGGTRVLRRPPSAGPPDPRDLDRFLSRVQEEAREVLGLTAREIYEALLDRLAATAGDRPVVYVVECSEWQSRCHAREIRERWDVETRSWPLTTRGEPPEAAVVSTLIHYNDIRVLWPRRLDRISFLAIHPDPALRERLAGRPEIDVFGRDEASARAAAADLSAFLPAGGPRAKPPGVRTLVRERPHLLFPLEAQGPPVLFPPRAWAALGEEHRSHTRAVELRYVLDERDLESLGRTQRWTPRPARRAR